MTGKKRAVIAVSVILVLSVVCAAVLPGVFTDGRCRRYYNTDVPDLGNVRLIARAVPVNGKDNTVSGAKEAVRLGAQGVVFDLCFLNDDTPVLCGDYRKRENCESVETLFREFSDVKYENVSIYLNIVQLSSFSVLNELAVKYNISSRVFLTGIDDQRYGLVSGDDTIIPFYLEYKPEKTVSGDYPDKRPECIDEYGACGLIVGKADFNADFSLCMSDLGVQTIVSGVKNRLDMCQVISAGALNVFTEDIGDCREALDSWINAVDIRYRESLEKSINALTDSAEQ